MKTHFIFLMTVFASFLCAQSLEFTGYFENQFFPQMVQSELKLQDYNKVRLDFSAGLGEKMSFNGDYIYRTYHGYTSFNGLDYIPESLEQEYLLQTGLPVDELRPYFEYSFKDENFLDNAYVSFYFKHLAIRLGKQQLPWGSGYAWNPTDIFNAKNVLDPTYEKVGVNALKIEIPFSSGGMITGIFGIEDTWDESVKAVKIKNHFFGFDVSASLVEKYQEDFDYFQFESFSRQRRLSGADFSGQIFGLGVWGEGATNYIKSGEDFGQYLLGCDYTLENGLYLMGEYYRNGLGKADYQNYTIGDWMRLISTTGENLGKDYLYLGQMYPLLELLDWSNYLIVNLNDRSGIFLPWFNFSLNDNAELLLAGYAPFGRKMTEFGEFGAGGFARVRVYF